MLAGVASWLVSSGWHVVLPSRRYCPIPIDEIEPVIEEPGRAIWVEARWERSQRLAHDAAKALDGEADLLVSWVHDTYRVPVLNAISGLLRPDAPIVEVHGSAVNDQVANLPEPALAGHPTQRVLLGYVREGALTRWLTHAEIVEGVLTAVRRALDDRPLTQHQVGELRPWPPPL
ncbi:MAG: hypothetical protein GEU86_08010 [Actinophytocola sp.]|nr:hypothetical protein [Actinophytocola sp.]